MNLIPMADNVLLKTYNAEETTKSGIILSTANKEKSSISEVVAIGTGTPDVKMVVKPGDKVIVSKYTGTELKFDNGEYTIVKQSDILAIVTDK